MQIMAKENKALDVLKFISCAMVVGGHIPQLLGNGIVNAYYNQWLFRYCVPFFFLSSGYFFQRSKNKERNIYRMWLLFLIGYILYFPNILKTNPGSSLISRLLWNAVFGYEHLWYISATLEGMVVWYLAEKIPFISSIFKKVGFAAAMVLLLLGALADEYYLLLDVDLLSIFAQFLQNYGGPRNSVFFGFPMLMLGGALARHEDKLFKIPAAILAMSVVLSFALSFAECYFLFAVRGMEISNDITLFNFWPAVFLFLLSFRVPVNISENFAKLLRKMSEHIYVLHWMMREIVGKYFAVGGIANWLLTMVACAAMSLVLIYLQKKRKKM